MNGNRARSTSNVNNEIISASYGNYLFVNSLKGNTSSFIDITRPTKIDLHVVTPENVNTTSVLSYTSTLAGNAFVRSIQFDSTSNGAANTYIYKLNLYNASTGALTGNATTSSTTTVLNLFDSATAPKFSDKSNSYDGASLIVTSGPGVGDIRPIVGYNGTSSPKKIYVDTEFSSIPTPSTNFSIVFSISNVDSLVNVNSSLVVQGSAIVDTKSKQSYIANGGTFLTTTDNPELIFRLGNPYVSDMSDSSYVSLREFRGILFSGAGTVGTIDILSGEQTTVSFPTISSNDDRRENLIVLVTDNGLNANVSNGEIIEITSSPRSVTSTANQISISTSDLLPFTATIFAKLEVNNADNSSYVRRLKTLVQANTTSLGIAGATATVNGVKIDLPKGQIYIPNPPSTVCKRTKSRAEIK